MTEKTPKTVLIVDDDAVLRSILIREFMRCNKEADCPYQFQVDGAESYSEAIDKIRAKKDYDVIVLDIKMEEHASGLKLNFELALAAQFGTRTPVRILFTGVAKDIPTCVEAMRRGAWDFIVKTDVGNTPAARIVVISALNRLRQLDLRSEQERRIARGWLPTHLRQLEERYGGQIIALWHKPEVTVIASGRDAFEVEDKLKEWRVQHKNRPWEQPYLVQIPAVPHDYQVEV